MYTKTPRELFLAALARNDFNTIEYYLCTSVSPNIRVDSELNTPMHYAVKNNNQMLVRLLLKYKPDFIIKNKAGRTVIELAAFVEAYDCLTIIATFCLVDKTCTLTTSDLALLKVFYSGNSNDLRPQPEEQTTLIELFKQAINQGNLVQIANCLDAGVSINLCVDKESNTPIHTAVILKNKKLVELLLTYNPDLSLLNKNKVSAKELAADTDAWECFQVLADYADQKSNSVRLIKSGEEQLNAKNTKENISSDGGSARFLRRENTIDPQDVVIQPIVPLSKRTTFIEAVTKEDLAQVKTCLESGVSINLFIDKELNTAIHKAVILRNTKLLELLLAYNPDLSLLNKSKVSAKQLAADTEAWECFQVFADYVEQKSNPFRLTKPGEEQSNARNMKEIEPQSVMPLNNRTLFMEAVTKEDLAQAKTCLESGVSINIVIDKELNTAIHKAVILRNTKLVELLLTYKPDISRLNKNKVSAIQLAVNSGAWDCYQLIAAHYPENAYKEVVLIGHTVEIARLLKKGLVNNRVDNKSNTLLHIGVKTQNLELIRLSLQNGGDIALKNDDGKTALELALFHKAWDSVKTIAENHPVVDASDTSYNGAFIIALRANKADVVKTLINAGASTQYLSTQVGEEYYQRLVDDKNEEMLAALDTTAEIRKLRYFNAIRKKDISYVEEVLKKKEFGINTQFGVAQNTGLHLAINNKSEHLTKLFLNSNISINLKNKAGLTAIELAVHSKEWSYLKIIVENCPCNNSNKSQYQFALLKAIESNQLDMVKMLLKAGVIVPVEHFSTMEGEQLLKKIKDNQWVAMTSLLMSESREFRLKFGILPESIKDYFEEIILSDELRVPTITPQGTTYNKEDINKLSQDPITRVPLKKDELTPNLIVYDLLAHYKQPNADIAKFPPCLICEETKVAFREPVVAGDGKTYEKGWITGYLLRNGNKTPTGYQQPINRPLYENRLVRTLIEEKYSPEKMQEEMNKEKYRKSFSPQIDLKSIEETLQAKTSANLPVDAQMNTGLHKAIEENNTKLINLLLAFGASLTALNKAGLTPMMLATKNKAWNCIKEIATCHPNDKTMLSQYDVPLIPALRANQIEVARFLLKAGSPMLYFTVPDGEKYFKELIENKDMEILELLMTEGKPDIVRPLVLKFGKMPEELMSIFEEPITFEELKNPLITPAGHTYDKETLAGLNLEPQTRSPLTQADLIPNLLVNDLIAYYKQPGVDLSKVPPCLICKETNKVFSRPVVAADGFTYEEAEIKKYLAEHGNLTPKGVKQTKSLYFNFLVQNLIDERNYLEPVSKKSRIADVNLGVSDLGQFGQKKKESGAENNPQLDVVMRDMHR